MKVNSDKSHFLTSGSKAIANSDNNYVESGDVPELLGITIYSELTLENRFNKLCKKGKPKAML